MTDEALAIRLAKVEGDLAALQVRQLPCQEWNCCEWALFAENTRIVHVKSALRRVVFGMRTEEGHGGKLASLARLWHELEGQVRHRGAIPA